MVGLTGPCFTAHKITISRKKKLLILGFRLCYILRWGLSPWFSLHIRGLPSLAVFGEQIRKPWLAGCPLFFPCSSKTTGWDLRLTPLSTLLTLWLRHCQAQAAAEATVVLEYKSHMEQGFSMHPLWSSWLCDNTSSPSGVSVHIANLLLIDCFTILVQKWFCKNLRIPQFGKINWICQYCNLSCLSNSLLGRMQLKSASFVLYVFYSLQVTL